MEFLLDGILSVTWQQLLMYGVGILLIWLAVKKEYEPALLLPMVRGDIGELTVDRCYQSDTVGCRRSKWNH